MAVNSYVIDGPSGLVIVDGQLTLSDARAVRDVIDRHGKDVAGLLVTHPHPDHYAGAATILDGLSAPIIATQSVAEVIERDDAEKDEIVAPMMGDEWPTIRRSPDSIVDDNGTVDLGGLSFSVRRLGAGESHDDTLFTVADTIVFSGDIAYNNMHAYLLDAHHEDWLALLSQLEQELTDDVTLYVGHGEPTDTTVLARQRRYVEAFVDVVRAHAQSDEGERHDRVVERMKQLVPNDDLLFLMELSIEPVLAASYDAW